MTFAKDINQFIKHNPNRTADLKSPGPPPRWSVNDHKSIFTRLNHIKQPRTINKEAGSKAVTPFIIWRKCTHAYIVLCRITAETWVSVCMGHCYETWPIEDIYTNNCPPRDRFCFAFSSIYWRSVESNVVWTSTFLKISSKLFL